METILVLILVAAAAIFSYARGWRHGLTLGHSSGIMTSIIARDVSQAVEQADSELREQHDVDSMPEEQYQRLLFERVDQLLAHKLSQHIKSQDQ